MSSFFHNTFLDIFHDFMVHYFIVNVKVLQTTIWLLGCNMKCFTFRSVKMGWYVYTHTHFTAFIHDHICINNLIVNNNSVRHVCFYHVSITEFKVRNN